MPKLDWRSIVADEAFSNTMRLIHLAARQDAYDEDAWRVDLLRARRRAYEGELTVQARNSGCPGRRGRLGNNEILTGLNEDSKADGASIANTFNYFLANAIIRIRQETPHANRHTYAKRLREWEPGYWGWKRPQIDEWTDGTARTKAQQDFFKYNGAGMGSARLEPRTAVCPICKGWVARGTVPLRVAMNNPGPFHLNCFPPGQKVLLPDWSEQNIEDVKIGDKVVTDVNGYRGATEVKSIFRRSTRELLYRLTINERILRTTGDHPIRTLGAGSYPVRTQSGWIPARELRVDDPVQVMDSYGGTPVRVQNVETEEYEGAVYNLETGAGEYIVEGVIVHNCPHLWNAKPDKAADCSILWLGE